MNKINFKFTLINKLTLVIFAFILLFLFFYQRHLFTNSNANTSTNEYLYNNYNLIEKMYFEDDQYAYFINSAYEYVEKPDNLYNFAWGISFLNKYDQNRLIRNIEGYRVRFDNLIFQFKNDNYFVSPISDLYMYVNIDKILYKDIKYKDLYNNKLMQHKDVDGLFYDVNINDIFDKIYATNTVSRILMNLNNDSGKLIDTKVSLINLFHEDKYFTEDIKDLQNGVSIINSLSNLDIPLDEIEEDLLERRRLWLEKINTSVSMQHYNTNNLFTILYFNQAILDLSIANNYLSVSNNFNLDYFVDLENLMNKHSFISFNKSIELQSTYKAYELLNIYKRHIADESLEKVANIIDFISDYGFNSVQNKFNIIDNYYGLLIAKELGMGYNQSKVMSMINNINIGELNIKELYYLTLTYEELDCLDDFKSILNDKLTSFINDSSNKELNSQVIYYITSIYEKLDLPISVKQISDYGDVLQNIIYKNKNSELTSDTLYYYVFSSEKLGLLIDDKYVIDLVYDYFKDGGFCNRIGDESNIYSTFEMYELISILDNYDINSNDKMKIELYIESLKGSKGGFLISNISSVSVDSEYKNFTLQSFYNGVKLIKMLNNSK